MPLSSAILTALRTEEARIERELDAVRRQVQTITELARGRGGKRGPGRPPGSTTKRKMSAAGRAAIARAAKKRWAAWRKAKGRK